MGRFFAIRRAALAPALLAFSVSAAAQQPAAETPFSRAVHLADSGRCPEAQPLLKRPLPAAASKELRRTVGIARVRCSMALNFADDATESLRILTRDFPDDPDVLYLAVHVYSDLSIRASNQLLRKAPGSYQVHQLNAEALEAQGKWDEAAEEYRAALKRDPSAPGIHYLLGRLILSKSATPTTPEDARREFEAELRINPDNAGAEYVLGELARQGEQLPQAIEHFGRATKLDAGFPDAFLGLGRCLLDADRTAEAIAPLERAVKLQPENPAAHFVLATAYQRAGRTEEATREFAAHKKATDEIKQANQDVRHGVNAGIDPAAPR